MLYLSENEEFQLKNTAVSLGKFDGIHRGHKLLINQILEEKEKGYTSVVFTFSLHPRSLFSDKELELIDTEEEKREKLEHLGVDVLVTYPFTRETASMEPEKFIEQVLIQKLGAKIIVVGSDFHFGKARGGDVELLRKMSSVYGYQLIVFDKLVVEDQIVSSTLIRNEIAKGNMELVSELLGEPYRIKSEIIYGNQIGRTIGIPTINQVVPNNKLLPPNGVYTSRVYIGDHTYYGITNVGYKPTVTDKKQKGIETNIFDFSGNLYGEIIEVELCHFVRPEVKFNSIEELKQQIESDSQSAREYFEIG